MRAAGAKKFVAELGSNAANIVLADADVDDAAKKIASAAFEASGQQCISAQRVLVEQPVYDEFLALFVAAAAKLKVGHVARRGDRCRPDGRDATPRERVMAMAQDAIDRGAAYALAADAGRLHRLARHPGRRAAQRPAVDATRSSARLRLVAPVRDVDDAIALANDSPFGLQGAVFTRSLAHALRFSEEFEVGALWVNEASRFRLDMYPFGGMKQSGVGREGVRYAIEELSQVKFTGIKL